MKKIIRTKNKRPTKAEILEKQAAICVANWRVRKLIYRDILNAYEGVRH